MCLSCHSFYKRSEKLLTTDWLWPPFLLDKLENFVAEVTKLAIPVDFCSKYKLSKAENITASFAHLLLKLQLQVNILGNHGRKIICLQIPYATWESWLTLIRCFSAVFTAAFFWYGPVLICSIGWWVNEVVSPFNIYPSCISVQSKVYSKTLYFVSRHGRKWMLQLISWLFLSNCHLCGPGI